MFIEFPLFFSSDSTNTLLEMFAFDTRHAKREPKLGREPQSIHSKILFNSPITRCIWRGNMISLQSTNHGYDYRACS